MPSGLPSPTTICRRLVTNDRAASSSGQALVDDLLQVRLVGGREHVGRTPPSMIAVARLAEPSVVTCTSTPGCASSKAASMSSNAPFSDVAASTVSVPSSSAPPRPWTWSCPRRWPGLVVTTGGDEQDHGEEGGEGTGRAHGGHSSQSADYCAAMIECSPCPPIASDRSPNGWSWPPGRGSRPRVRRWPASSRPVARSVGCGPRAARSPTEPSTSWPPRADRARPDRARPRSAANGARADANRARRAGRRGSAPRCLASATCGPRCWPSCSCSSGRALDAAPARRPAHAPSLPCLAEVRADPDRLGHPVATGPGRSDRRVPRRRTRAGARLG